MQVLPPRDQLGVLLRFNFAGLLRFRRAIDNILIEFVPRRVSESGQFMEEKQTTFKDTFRLATATVDGTIRDAFANLHSIAWADQQHDNEGKVKASLEGTERGESVGVRWLQETSDGTWLSCGGVPNLDPHVQTFNYVTYISTISRTLPIDYH